MDRHPTWLSTRVVPYVFLALVVWLNVYVCRELFLVETTARMNSMHGFWAAIARLAGSAWWTPTWWPYWDNGLPFEYTYAPGVPALMALLSRTAGVSELRALHMLMGLVYALGPAMLFLVLWRMSRAVGWSFAAAVAYSLLSPALLVAPNESFSFAALWGAERLFVISDWDETPHMFALALWPVAVLCLFRILETRRWSWIAFGALTMAAMVYVSAFGATLLAISAVCVLASFGWSRSHALLLVLAGVLTYMGACIALPPSLIRLIRAAATLSGEGWTVRSATTLAIVGLVWTLLLPWLYRRVLDTYLRFFVLFTTTVLLIVCLHQYLGRQFVPQPGRYKFELSLGLVVCVVFGLRPLWRRVTPRRQLATTVVFLALAAEQVASHRAWAKNVLQPHKLADTIESRAAVWMDANLPGEARVSLPGSMAQWLNAFSARPQWTGGSWSTAVNPQQQRAVREVFAEQGSADRSLLWLKAYGVQAVAVSGDQSPEYWKPYADKKKFEGKLEPLWSAEDTTLYRVPLRSASLAHALPESALPGDAGEGVKGFVAALETERAPGLAFMWNDRNNATVTGDVRNGEAVALQVTHHAGWNATANGRQAPIRKDALGLMWIQPSCNGPCTIQLAYSGGAELLFCRWLSAATLFGLVVLLVWSLRTRSCVN